jgi:uncharacterized protein
VFGDPCTAPLRAAQAAGRLELLIDAACEAELARVLAYPLGKWTLDAARQQECLAELRKLCSKWSESPVDPARLPQCRDSDDQKFLELALSAGADVLLTKDAELLRLARRALPFRILNPREFNIPTCM